MKRKLDSQNMDEYRQKKKKIKIPSAVRKIVWNKFIGSDIKIGECYICKTPLDAFDFDCAHITAEYKGGEVEIDNLRPTCRGCNCSVHIKNMKDFVEEHKIDSKLRNEQVPIYTNDNDLHDKNKISTKHEQNKQEVIDTFVDTLKTDEILFYLIMEIAKYMKNKNVIILCHCNNIVKNFIEKLFNIILTSLDENTSDPFSSKKSKAIYYSKDIPTVNYVKYCRNERFKNLIAININRIDIKVIEKLNSCEGINNKQLLNKLTAIHYDNNEFEKEMLRAIILKNDYLVKYCESNIIKANHYVEIKYLHEHIKFWCCTDSRCINPPTQKEITEYFKNKGDDCDTSRLKGYQINYRFNEYIQDVIVFTENPTDKYYLHSLQFSYLNWYDDKTKLQCKLIDYFAKDSLFEWLKQRAKNSNKKITYDKLFISGLLIKNCEKYKEPNVKTFSFSDFSLPKKDPFASFFKY